MDDPSDSQEHKEDSAQNNAPIVPSTGKEHSPDTSKKTGHCCQHREKKKKKWSDLELHDKAIIELTLGLLLITGVTAFVLVRQANIFEKQLEEMKGTGLQTERLIMLNIGQLTNAAKTAVAAKEQASAAQDSVKAIQRQMRQDQRAWLNIELGDIFWVENQPLRVRMKLTNKGKTPAKDVVGHAFVEKILINQKPHFQEHEQRFGTGFLVPNAPIDNWGFQSGRKHIPVTMSKTDVLDLREGRAIAVVHGEITYFDVFGVHHWTKFCNYGGDNAFIATEAIQNTAEICTKYNDADNN